MLYRSARFALLKPLVALVLALLCIASVSASFPAHAAARAPLVAGLSVSAGPPGTDVVLTGTGFTPGESVQPLWVNPTTNATITEKSFYLFNPVGMADANGNVVTSIFAPSIAVGNYNLVLKGLKSGLSQSFPFTLQPKLDLGQYIGGAGTVLRLVGWGLGARETVSLYWNWTPTNSGTLIVKAKTDSKGFFSGRTFTIPAGTANGTYMLAAIGATSGVVATTAFTVGTLSLGGNPGPSDWSTFGFDPQQTRVNPNETTINASNVNTLALKWQGAAVQSYKTVGSPVIANGIAYVGTIAGNVSAYDITTGALLWNFAASGPLYGSPTFANGIAYFGTVEYPAEGTIGNYAYALNAQTGALIWDDFLPRGGEWVAPLAANGMVYFSSALKEGVSGGFNAFNALTGATVWSLSTPYGIWAPTSLDPTGTNLYVPTGNPCTGNAPPAPNDGCSGYILDLNAMTGKTTWSYHFPDLSGDDDAPAAPLYSQGYLYIGLKNGNFYKMDATNGAIIWQYNTGKSGDYGIYSSATIANGLVIFGGGDHLVHALDVSTGNLVWSFKTGSLVTSSPSFANGVVYVGSIDGHLYALDPATGNLLWNAAAGFPIWSSPAIVNGVVYAVTGLGALDAFTLGGV